MSFSESRVGSTSPLSVRAFQAESENRPLPDVLPKSHEAFDLDSEEMAGFSLLDETLMGLDKVSVMLQESLMDIQNHSEKIMRKPPILRENGSFNKCSDRRRSDSMLSFGHTSGARDTSAASALLQELRNSSANLENFGIDHSKSETNIKRKHFKGWYNQAVNEDDT